MTRTRMIRYVWTTTLLLVLGLAVVLQAEASVVLAGTRVIFNANERETTVRLSNEGKVPALTQVWLDKGDPKAAPSEISVPFTVTPPVSRIDPGKGQTLRIFYTGEALPRDKESVFWLNVLEIPPEASGEANKLQLAFRTRIKLFFRPAGLAGTAQDAPAKTEWRLLPGGKQVQVRNPTPYFISFSAFEIEGNGKSVKFDDGGMVGPGDTQVFALNTAATPAPGLKVHYHAISDFGGAIDGEAALAVTP
ncbi:fimbria/pilus periplasmic chaperone [Cupriavidus metallidurans]|nr:fimbria/pilus periplasmic chaperone [Cupriavidus metallidurans]